MQQQFTLDQKTVTAQHKWKVGDPTVEAQGIAKTADGRILLGKLLKERHLNQLRNWFVQQISIDRKSDRQNP